MQKNPYNGWFNYETWLFNLHFDNFWYEDAQECFREAQACDTFSKSENATLELMERINCTLEEFHAEAVPENNGFFSDLLNSAVQEVNTHEVAKHYIEQIEADNA